MLLVSICLKGIYKKQSTFQFLQNRFFCPFIFSF
jgi:hypothetical protein